MLKIGDRVRVNDPALKSLADIMRNATGEEPPANDTGVIDTIYDDGTAVILFDDSGSAAPYPLADCEAI